MPSTTIGKRLIRASKVLFDKREELLRMPVVQRTELALTMEQIALGISNAVDGLRAGDTSSTGLEVVAGAADDVFSRTHGAMADGDAREIRDALRDARLALQLAARRTEPDGKNQLGKLDGAVAVFTNLARVLKGEAERW